MIDLSYGGSGIFLADICKCVLPGITPVKHLISWRAWGVIWLAIIIRLPITVRNLRRLTSRFLAGRTSAYRLLVNHAENIICNHP